MEELQPRSNVTIEDLKTMITNFKGWFQKDGNDQQDDHLQVIRSGIQAQNSEWKSFPDQENRTYE
jgi:hypothetical protein